MNGPSTQPNSVHQNPDRETSPLLASDPNSSNTDPHSSSEPSPLVAPSRGSSPSLINPSATEWTIPAISDAVLAERSKHIHPLRRDSDDNLRLVPPHDPRCEAFSMVEGHGEGVRGLQEVARITTFHSTGYALFFKPSVAEVLAQIPPELYACGICAFETMPASHGHISEIMDPAQTMHRAVTILYKPEQLQMERYTVDDSSIRARQIEECKRFEAPSATDLDSRFAGTHFVVRADSHEQFAIWKRLHQELHLGWEDDRSGVSCALGYREDMPVMASFRWATIEGQRVLFVSSDSLVTDWSLVDDWLKINCNPALPDGRRAFLSAAQFANPDANRVSDQPVLSEGDHRDYRFEETFFVVEASPFSQHALRNENEGENCSSWDPDPQSLRIPIGEFAGRPVEFVCSWATIDGKRVLFYSEGEGLAHHGMTREWLEAHCNPQDASGRRSHSDAMNFGHCIHAIREANPEQYGE